MSHIGRARWILLGYVGKAHGLQGAFFVEGREAPVPATYRNVRFGQTPEEGEAHSLVKSYSSGGRPVIRCSAPQDRESVEELRGTSLWVEREHVDVADDEYLLGDLEGCRVLDCQGVVLGHVEALYNVGASDVMQVRSGDNGRLDIPVVSSYVDTNFPELAAGVVSLVVEGEVFDDLWVSNPSPK